MSSNVRYNVISKKKKKMYDTMYIHGTFYHMNRIYKINIKNFYSFIYDSPRLFDFPSIFGYGF